MLRFTDGSAQIRPRSDWNHIATRRQNDPFWRTLDIIQIAPAAKHGIGEAITFDFTSPLFSGDPKAAEAKRCYLGVASFDYKSFLLTQSGEKISELSLMLKKPLVYALMVCNKVGFFL